MHKMVGHIGMIMALFQVVYTIQMHSVCTIMPYPQCSRLIELQQIAVFNLKFSMLIQVEANDNLKLFVYGRECTLHKQCINVKFNSRYLFFYTLYPLCSLKLIYTNIIYINRLVISFFFNKQTVRVHENDVVCIGT